MANRKLSSLWLKYHKTCADGYANNEYGHFLPETFFAFFCDTSKNCARLKICSRTNGEKVNRNRN